MAADLCPVSKLFEPQEVAVLYCVPVGKSQIWTVD